jgi:2-aminoadipate transaminase
MEEIYHRAAARNVAFVPGRFFFADGEQGVETARLNFTMADEETLEGAVKILADVL